MCQHQASSVRKGFAITTSEYRINREIRAREVRLIIEEENERGEVKARNVGVVPTLQALQMAQDMGLDLVEVAPDANPPVCKALDYGKFLYEQQRKERKARKNQVVVKVKEIQLKPKTDDHHLGFKIKEARKWLEDGMKVKIRVRFRGREITHAHIGRDRLEEIKNLLSDVGVVEQMPNIEGRDMLMVLAPIGEKK
ncbi:MAG: translation initiation factor IF-3 [Anaerolinea sp.]